MFKYIQAESSGALPCMSQITSLIQGWTLPRRSMRYEETDTALEPLSSLATWFTCNTQGGSGHIRPQSRDHFYPFHSTSMRRLCLWCWTGISFSDLPKNNQKHNMSLAQHCFSLWFPPASLSELGLWAPCSATTTVLLQGFRALDSTWSYYVDLCSTHWWIAFWGTRHPVVSFIVEPGCELPEGCF